MSLRLAQVAEVRLGRQRAPQYEQGDHVLPYLRSANVVDGRLDLTDVKSMNFTPVEQAIFGLADGDVLMTEGSGSADTVGTSAVWRTDLPGTVCFQNTLLRLRPRTGVTDGRFLAWWARHAHASGQIAAVSSGANIQHIGSDGLKDLRIHVPEIWEQRRIADFLDDRVTRIDHVIAARHKQKELSIESLGSALELAVSEVLAATKSRRLASMASIASGEFLPSTSFDEQAPVPVYGGNGIAGRYVASNAYEGSIVVGRVGALCGNVHLLPESAWVTDNALVVRLRETSLAPSFVAAVLDAAELNSLASQTAQPLVTGTQVGDCRIPLAPSSLQATIIQKWREKGSATGVLLDQAITLLQEYKQSLITAAVSGELDVTTAGSEIPE